MKVQDDGDGLLDNRFRGRRLLQLDFSGLAGTTNETALVHRGQEVLS